MAKIKEKVLEVKHYTDTLFYFKTTRDPGTRFTDGEFMMVGMEIEGKPLLRAYSVVSPNHQEHLEFYSIKIEVIIYTCSNILIKHILNFIISVVDLII